MLKKKYLLFFSLLLLGFFLFTSCLPRPPVTEGILKGRVMVPEELSQAKQLTGQALVNALVNIIDPLTGNIIATTTTTDANGYYRGLVLPGGPYLLQVVKEGMKVQQVTPSVEVGKEYDLGTADYTTTAVALIFQAMLEDDSYPDNPADINLADIEANPDFAEVLNSVYGVLGAGEDPVVSAVVQQAVEDFLHPPTSTPNSTVPAVAATTAATVINIAAIAGVTAPVTGAVPVATITATVQYTGTVTWAPTDSPFASATAYTATIIITPKAGYTLTGVGANFFTVAGATATNTINTGVVTAVFPATAAAVINIAAIAGVTAPVTGAVPVATIADTTEYTATITWSGSPSTFASATAYTATIIITPKAGYTLTGVGANFFTVAGATATNTINTGVVTAVFPATAAAVINIAAIAGVTAPVTGAVPVATITATAQYTGTVTWAPANNPFLGSQAYTATITLTPKAGFTLTGVGVNFFTVTGATTDTNPINSGVVTAVFPATAAAVINIAAIGVTAPVVGAVPVATITATVQYTGTVTWAPVHNPFQVETVYTATITLTAKTGYTLTGVAQNFFTVAGATTATNPINSGVVTAVFPKTLLVVGNSYGGGKVAYILVSGETIKDANGNVLYSYDANIQHGLIAAAADQSAGITWSNITGTLIGTTGTTIGTGQANTTAIVGQSGCTSGAAKLCDDLILNTYTDWYLPSKYELDRLREKRFAIDNFAGNYYWSSSEGTAGTAAWFQDFSGGGMAATNKSYTYCVRAVRAF